MSKYESWSVNDVVQELNSSGFESSVSSCFSRHEILGNVLPLMEDEHLKEIGVTDPGQRLHVLKWIFDLTKDSPLRTQNPEISYRPQPKPKFTPTSSPSKSPEPSYSNQSPTKSQFSNSMSKTQSPNSMTKTQSPTSKPTTASSKNRQAPTRSSTNSMPTSSKPQNRPQTASNQENVPKFKRDHDKMVEQIRAARKYAAYQKAVEEGRAVGPPPELPPIEEPPDLVPCPYCGRKFGEEAARRHIPVCERTFSSSNRPRRK